MGTERRHVLIVGAGFAGAVYARSLADAGVRVDLIDKRLHIGGNAYDEVGADGIRIHRYGPHLFHSANQRVVEWIKRFATWEPFTHRVNALLPTGVNVPMPINLDTINMVFDACFTSNQAEEHLRQIALPIDAPRNAAEYLGSRIGRELTDLFFRPYTKKMWAMDLEELDASVVKRIPLRLDRVDTYFPENQAQVMPVRGYAEFFERLLFHPLIKISLATEFDPAMMKGCLHTFASMPIDEYFGFCHGELPYRSIKFHHKTVPASELPPHWGAAEARHSVVNFTDDGPFTRETAWHRLPHHIVSETGVRTLTREEPCDYRDNAMERYYPVKRADSANEDRYVLYADLARRTANRVTFIGRCGTYRYLDMDQVINQSLVGARNWLQAQAITEGASSANA